jgi:hypothetical protein
MVQIRVRTTPDVEEIAARQRTTTAEELDDFEEKRIIRVRLDLSQILLEPRGARGE